VIAIVPRVRDDNVRRMAVSFPIDWNYDKPQVPPPGRQGRSR